MYHCTGHCYSNILRYIVCWIFSKLQFFCLKYCAEAQLLRTRAGILIPGLFTYQSKTTCWNFYIFLQSYFPFVYISFNNGWEEPLVWWCPWVHRRGTVFGCCVFGIHSWSGMMEGLLQHSIWKYKTRNKHGILEMHTKQCTRNCIGIQNWPSTPRGCDCFEPVPSGKAIA